MISVQELMKFGYTQEQAKKIIGTHRVSIKDSSVFENKLKEIEKNYGINRKKAIKTILSNPQFAELNHNRVLKDITKIYGVNKQQAIKTIMSFPQFAGYDHNRVLRQKLRVGKALGLNKKQVLNIIFSSPVTAGTSFHRDFAYIRALQHEGIKGLTQKQLIEFYKKNYINSPYVRAKVKLNSNESAKEMKLSIKNYEKLKKQNLIEGKPKTGTRTAWDGFKTWKKRKVK
jgi:hypothetical protein